MGNTAPGAAAAAGSAATGPLPNLWAEGLSSYAFGVHSAMGSKPMRYLLARRFAREPATAAVTMLFVIEPTVLFGTYVHIAEDIARQACVVHTCLPTMTRPLQVPDNLMFDCLPLTDVGYVDLMAWLPPALRPVAGGPPAADAVPAVTPTSARSFRFDGDPGRPPLWMHQEVDDTLGIIVRRTFWRAGVEIRRWEVTERGEPGHEALPRGIRVSRPQTGHETGFIRSTVATAVPSNLFDASPSAIRDWVNGALNDGTTEAPRPST